MAEQQPKRDYETIIKGMEVKAGQLLSSYAYDASEDKETSEIIQAEVDFCSGFCQLIREGAYKVYDSGVIQDALAKAKQDIYAYLQHFQPMIDQWQEGIDKVNYDYSVFSEKNRDRNWTRHEKEGELHKLGFLDGARKRELKAEIAQLQPLEPPYDFDAKIRGFQTLIDGAKERMEPYQDLMKGVTFYELEAERKQAKEKPQERKATRQESQGKNYDPQEFYNYLRDKGFNDNGANEVINRIAQNRPDREDLYQLRSFEKATGQQVQKAVEEVAQSFHRATRGR